MANKIFVFLVKIFYLHKKNQSIVFENVFKILNKKSGFFEIFFIFVDQLKKKKNNSNVLRSITTNINNKKRICQIIKTVVSYECKISHNSNQQFRLFHC